MNLPNQITVARLLMAVVFCALLCQYDARAHAAGAWRIDVCAWLFIVAALSDIVDGYLARKQNQVTSFGRVIDPFVDKVLVCSAFILLAGRNFVDEQGRSTTGIEAWMVVVIIARELLVSSLRGMSEGEGKAYAALAWGKGKMLVQSITVPWVLFSLTATKAAWWDVTRTAWIWATVVITAVSVLPYLGAARHILAERRRA